MRATLPSSPAARDRPALRRRQIAVDSTVTAERSTERADVSVFVMSNRPVEVSLEVNPAARLDVIYVCEEVREHHGDVLQPFPRALY